MICKAAAVILDGAGRIEDRLLRAYIRDRLLGSIAPKAKPKRGRSSKDTWGRDAVILGRLIPPLLNRFKATRNKASRNKDGAVEFGLLYCVDGAGTHGESRIRRNKHDRKARRGYLAALVPHRPCQIGYLTVTTFLLP